MVKVMDCGGISMLFLLKVSGMCYYCIFLCIIISAACCMDYAQIFGMIIPFLHVLCGFGMIILLLA